MNEPSGTRVQEPEIRNQRSGTRDQEPEIRNQRSGTRDQEPEIRNQRPEPYCRSWPVNVAPWPRGLKASERITSKNITTKRRVIMVFSDFLWWPAVGLGESSGLGATQWRVWCSSVDGLRQTAAGEDLFPRLGGRTCPFGLTGRALPVPVPVSSTALPLSTHAPPTATNSTEVPPALRLRSSYTTSSWASTPDTHMDSFWSLRRRHLTSVLQHHRPPPPTLSLTFFCPLHSHSYDSFVPSLHSPHIVRTDVPCRI